MSDRDQILKEYADEATYIIPMFEALSSADVLAPVAAFLPDPPCRVADIGAGTGRDAAWFAAHGYEVCAVEPVAELAAYGKEHHAPAIEWVDDSLPDLPHLRATARQFDLVFVGSVWHHLSPAESTGSLAALHEILGPGGRLIISLKEFAQGGPAISTDTLVQHIRDAGMAVIHQSTANPHQDHNKTAGNMWTWLVIEHGNGDAG